ncbi:MAG: glutamine-hydrolyzing GMP synthase [Candidatus Aenigmatarchaeota archaeon]
MFKPQDFIEKKILEIKKEVGEGKAVVACSGGVDSTTCAVLAKKAIGNRVLAVYIDDGFRRLGEPEKVLSLLKKLGVKNKLIKAERIFFDKLKGIKDAEEKRKVFREIFYDILNDVVEKEGAEFLIQGTIAADIKETVKGIKTQHNVLQQAGVDMKKYKFKIIEPLKELYKNDVRKVAKSLGLPDEIVNKMPFPGPGLLIRVLGEVTPEKVEIVRKGTEIVERETRRIKHFQSFVALMSDKATGILNGKRNYGYVMVIRIVSSQDAMKAKAMEIPFSLLKRISSKILREIPQVSRCLYDITDKPPATIEFE